MTTLHVIGYSATTLADALAAGEQAASEFRDVARRPVPFDVERHVDFTVAARRLTLLCFGLVVLGRPAAPIRMQNRCASYNVAQRIVSAIAIHPQVNGFAAHLLLSACYPKFCKATQREAVYQAKEVVFVIP